MKNEVALIAPDQELLKLVEDCRTKIDLPFTAIYAPIDNIIEITSKLIMQGAKILISRGGWAKIIKENFDLPMVEIDINVIDIMHLIDQARQIGNRIAVISVDFVIDSVTKIAPFINIEVTPYLLSKLDMVEELVERAASQGAEVIIGASAAASLARERGLKAILLRTGEDSVLAALREAARLKAALQNEVEWGLRQKAVLDSIDDCLLTLDENGGLTSYNHVAKREFNLNQGQLSAPPGFLNDQVLKEAIMSHQQIQNRLTVINKIHYVVQVNPIISSLKSLGTVIKFQKVTDVQHLEQNIRRHFADKGHVARYRFEDLIGADPQSERLFAKAASYAQVDSTILIEGESGTGKEGLAQSIHQASPRADQPFVAINCLAVPETLLESELFGFKEGAFTGARKGGKPGLLEMAHNGTLFLDEIAEISPGFQARLLRVLEERVVQRVGDDRLIPIDVRIISATNQPLGLLVAQKKFRQDLFYRLNVLNLKIQPLRERRGDIEALVDHFLQYFRQTMSRPSLSVSSQAKELLLSYDYPGNVRQLRNIIERLVVSGAGPVLDSRDVEEAVGQGACPQAPSEGPRSPRGPGPGGLAAMEERKLFIRVVEECGGNKSAAARRLGVSPVTLWRKLRGA
ncbi:MAG: sigma 54-interacting transcriptional regulator [Deltaproteobacteria bacterium]|jgi:transcriptional regulator with PAS, ATPase and Fis domain|nr:sigma 54-interacting transcriptional regulator [Deltaproteobacteria bacterium]